MEIARRVERMQVGRASPAHGARRSVRLSPRRGRAVCFEQWSRLKDVLGMHKRYTVLTSSGMCSALGGRVLMQTPRYCCAL